MKRPTPLVRTFTENLMAYALGRRVEYFDQPAIRAISEAAEAEQLQDVVVHPRRGEERRRSGCGEWNREAATTDTTKASRALIGRLSR